MIFIAGDEEDGTLITAVSYAMCRNLSAIIDIHGVDSGDVRKWCHQRV